MKPIILIVYKMEDLSEVKVYYSIEQLSQLRHEVAESMKQVYGIELRTLFWYRFSFLLNDSLWFCQKK